MIFSSRRAGEPQSLTGDVFHHFSQESAVWDYLEEHISWDTWDLAYESILKNADHIRMIERARSYLDKVFSVIDDDIVRADLVLLIVRLSAAQGASFGDSSLYRHVLNLEAQAGSSFVRSRVIQAEGLLAHIMANNMLVIGNLIDRGVQANSDCAVAHVRALKRAYLVRPEMSIRRAVEAYQASSDYSVKSETLLQLSSIQFHDSLQALDRNEYLGIIDESLALARACLNYDPDRPDAERLVELLEACRLVAEFPVDRSAIEEKSLRLRLLWRLSLSDDWDEDPRSVEAQLLLVEAFERIAAILTRLESLPRQINLASNLIELAESAVFLESLAGFGNGFGSIGELGLSVLVRKGFHEYLDVHVKRSIWASIQHSKAKIQQLAEGLREYSPDAGVLAYYVSVLDLIDKIEQGRITRYDPAVLVVLGRLYPERSPEEIELSINDHALRGGLEGYLLSLLNEATQKLGEFSKPREFLGGYPKAQRMLVSIGERLTLFSVKHREIAINFMNVANYLVRFLIVAAEQKISARFLLSEKAGGKGVKAVEGDLEECLFNFLLGTDIAFAIRRQDSLATGRVDISASFETVVFPIEVKREFGSIDRSHIEQAYLAQTISYSRSHSALSFLVVLDLTDKLSGGPLVNLEELVFLAESPSSEPPGYNYVLVVIVPGNMPRPSDLSTYSQRKS